MLDSPAELTKTDLVAGSSRSWRLDARAVDYLPLGAGSYDWAAVAQHGPRFVTVDDLALCRPWWTLADVAACTADLGRPHGSGGDSSVALTHLRSYLQRTPTN